MSRFTAFVLISLLMLTGPCGQACDDLLLLGRTDNFAEKADSILSEAHRAVEKHIKEYLRVGAPLQAPAVGSGFALPDLITYETLKHFHKLAQDDEPIAQRVFSESYEVQLSFLRSVVEIELLQNFASLLGLKAKDLEKHGMGNDQVDYFALHLQKAKRLRDVRTPLDTVFEPKEKKHFMFTNKIAKENEPTMGWVLNTNYPGTTADLVNLQRFGLFSGKPNSPETLRELLIEAGYLCDAPKQLPPDMPTPAGLELIFVK